MADTALDTLLIDTDVLIDCLRGRDEARVYIEGLTPPPYLSAATVAELYAGVLDSERDDLDAFIAAFRILPVTEEIARNGGLHRRDYWRSHGTGLVDGIIAATALQIGSGLVTLNLRHYPMLNAVLVPY